MKLTLLFSVLILFCSCKAQTNGAGSDKQTQTNTSTQSTQSKMENKNIYDIKVKDMDGKDVKLSDYSGKVLLIVNVASHCGYTVQYEALQKLYEQNKDKGFEILAFPCNDFGEQEPGTNEEIQQFCSSKYNVTFKLFDKVKVLGDDKTPLYNRLVNNAPETGDIGWNFEKFLIDKKGNIVGRYKSKVKPDSDELVSAINAELSK
jgi:glutathione peroxidase